MDQRDVENKFNLYISRDDSERLIVRNASSDDGYPAESERL